MSSRKLQQGSSLIEVLVAVLVLSVGMVGALRLQSEAVKQNADSRYVTQASLFAQTALEGFAAGKGAWVGQAAWEGTVRTGLPQGEVAVDCASTPNVCNVVISWIPPGGVDREKARYAVRVSS